MATNADQHVLVNINLHGQQLKDFVVDNVSIFPPVIGEPLGRMIYYNNELWINKDVGWTKLEDSYEVKVTSTDTPGLLEDKIVKGNGIEVYNRGLGGGVMAVEISNTRTYVQFMDDVNWGNPGQDTLFGWDNGNKKFKPIHIDPTMELVKSGTIWSLRARPKSNYYTWAVKGKTDAGSYHGLYIRLDNESVQIVNLMIRCRSGNGEVQIKAASNYVNFTSGRTGSRGKSWAIVNGTMNELNCNVWAHHKMYIELFVQKSTNMEDLHATLQMRQY